MNGMMLGIQEADETFRLEKTFFLKNPEAGTLCIPRLAFTSRKSTGKGSATQE